MMEIKKNHGKEIFAAAVFVAAVFVFAITASNPTPIQIFVNGSETAVSQVPGVFTTIDVIILVASAIVFTVCGMYLLFFDYAKKPEENIETPFGELVLEERKRKWEEIIKTLKNDEQEIYKTLIDFDGIIQQSELAEKTGISKSNISRALDLLESKGLVEKRRRGMGNIVLLK